MKTWVFAALAFCFSFNAHAYQTWGTFGITLGEQGYGYFTLGDKVGPGKYDVESISISMGNCIKDFSDEYPGVEWMEQSDCGFPSDDEGPYYLTFDIKTNLFEGGQLNSRGHSLLIFDWDTNYYGHYFLSRFGMLGVSGGEYIVTPPHPAQEIPEPLTALLLPAIVLAFLANKRGFSGKRAARVAALS